PDEVPCCTAPGAQALELVTLCNELLHTVFTKAEHAQVNRLGEAFGRERLRYCKEFNRCGRATRARRCSGNASVDI
ncbi:MAG: hypothetical protein RIT06_868, partial [Chloroflexota bacterium]